MGHTRRLRAGMPADQRGNHVGGIHVARGPSSLPLGEGLGLGAPTCELIRVGRRWARGTLARPARTALLARLPL